MPSTRPGHGERTTPEAAASERGIAVFPDVRRAARTVHSLIEWRSRREGLSEIL